MSSTLLGGTLPGSQPQWHLRQCPTGRNQAATPGSGHGCHRHCTRRWARWPWEPGLLQTHHSTSGRVSRLRREQGSLIKCPEDCLHPRGYKAKARDQGVWGFRQKHHLLFPLQPVLIQKCIIDGDSSRARVQLKTFVLVSWQWGEGGEGWAGCSRKIAAHILFLLIQQKGLPRVQEACTQAWG